MPTFQMPSKMPPMIDQCGGWCITCSIPNQGTSHIFILGHQGDEAGARAAAEWYTGAAFIIAARYFDSF